MAWASLFHKRSWRVILVVMFCIVMLIATQSIMSQTAHAGVIIGDGGSGGGGSGGYDSACGPYQTRCGFEWVYYDFSSGKQPREQFRNGKTWSSARADCRNANSDGIWAFVIYRSPNFGTAYGPPVVYDYHAAPYHSNGHDVIQSPNRPRTNESVIKARTAFVAATTGNSISGYTFGDNVGWFCAKPEAAYDLSVQSRVNGKTGTITYKKSQGVPDGELKFTHSVTKTGSKPANDIQVASDVYRVAIPENENFGYEAYGPTRSFADGTTNDVKNDTYTVKESDWGRKICGRIRVRPFSSTSVRDPSIGEFPSKVSDPPACAILDDDTVVGETCPDGSPLPASKNPNDCPKPPDPPICLSDTITWGPTTKSATCSYKEKTQDAGNNGKPVTLPCPSPCGKNPDGSPKTSCGTCPNPEYESWPDESKSVTYDCPEIYTGSAKVTASPSPSAVDPGDAVKFTYSISYSGSFRFDTGAYDYSLYNSGFICPSNSRNRGSLSKYGMLSNGEIQRAHAR